MTEEESAEPIQGEAGEEEQIEAEQFEKMTVRELFTRLIDSAEQETGIELKPMHYSDTILRWGRKMEAPTPNGILEVQIVIGDQKNTSLHICAICDDISRNGDRSKVEVGLAPAVVGLKEIHQAGKYEQDESFESYARKTLETEVSVPRSFLTQFEKGVKVLGYYLKQYGVSELRDTKIQETFEQSEGFEERVRIADELLRRKR